MAKIKFTAALKRFFPNLQELEIDGNTVAEVVEEIDSKYPGIKNYILNERGAVRKHMNIFVKGELIEDEETLQDIVNKQDEIIIFQALSGG